MIVGISTIEIFFPENQSLKDKRQLLRRIVEKTRARFSISIMEIDQNNLWQRAKIGFSVIGVKQDHVNKMIDNVHEYIESLYIGSIIDTKTEIILMGNEILKTSHPGPITGRNLPDYSTRDKRSRHWICYYTGS
jgi:hypothetical protein